LPKDGVSEAERSGGIYVDTSALGRLLLREPDSEAILEVLRGFERWVASALLRVELMRLGLRRGLATEAVALLATIATLPLTEARLRAAEAVEPVAVATLDAIHLVTALELFEAGQIDTVLTFDRQLTDAAEHHGLVVLAPD